jgi:hypothetical protein
LGQHSVTGVIATIRSAAKVWDKSFIRVQFTIRQKDQTVSGFQMIGKDPASRELRSWTFESAGGFGEATWSRDGKT